MKRVTRPVASLPLPEDFAARLEGLTAEIGDWLQRPRAEAHDAGMAIGVVGWYHPYCRLFISFLSSCELRATVAYCACVLGYLEANYTVSQVDAYFAAGTIPSAMQPGINACRLAVL